MNRYWIIAVMASALALIGLATVPAIQAAWPRSEALAPVNLAPPQAAGFSGPQRTWSAYQPIEGISSQEAPDGSYQR